MSAKLCLCFNTNPSPSWPKLIVKDLRREAGDDAQGSKAGSSSQVWAAKA